MAMPALAPHERRTAERIDVVVEVTLQSEHNFYAGFTSDISEGGVFIATPDPAPIGEVVSFKLKLGKGDVDVQGEVRWVREPSDLLDGVSPGMGIRFLALTPPVSAAINEFIRSRRDAIFYDDEPM
jgi:uncharacterized protein (TIGR02266 family)